MFYSPSGFIIIIVLIMSVTYLPYLFIKALINAFRDDPKDDQKSGKA